MSNTKITPSFTLFFWGQRGGGGVINQFSCSSFLLALRPLYFSPYVTKASPTSSLRVPVTSYRVSAATARKEKVKSSKGGKIITNKFTRVFGRILRGGATRLAGNVVKLVLISRSHCVTVLLPPPFFSFGIFWQCRIDFQSLATLMFKITRQWRHTKPRRTTS